LFFKQSQDKLSSKFIKSKMNQTYTGYPNIDKEP